jgi:hypothetical protein
MIRLWKSSALFRLDSEAHQSLLFQLSTDGSSCASFFQATESIAPAVVVIFNDRNGAYLRLLLDAVFRSVRLDACQCVFSIAVARRNRDRRWQKLGSLDRQDNVEDVQ